MSVTLKVTCDRCGRTFETSVEGIRRLKDIESVLSAKIEPYSCWTRFSGKDLCRDCTKALKDTIARGPINEL